jgi:hypothetical protein
MKRQDINYIVSLLLLAGLCATGATGYIQSQLELRKFIPHQYFAYGTLILAAVHVCLNAGKMWRYIRRQVKHGDGEGRGNI